MSENQPLLQPGTAAPPGGALPRVVERYDTTEVVPGTDTTFATWAPSEGTGYPVVLFQSGYLSTSTTSHADLLEKIAAEGFVVIAPVRASDQRCGCCGPAAWMSSFLGVAAMSVDGSNLKMAYEYAQNKSNKLMDKGDVSKLTLAGFSMGAQEVVHAQQRLPTETKAAIIISGSLMRMGYVLGWNLCCCTGVCTGTNAPCFSDTPISCCGMEAAAQSWTIPSLFVTAEGDLAKAGTNRFYGLAGGDKTMVTFKDSALDLTLADSSGGPDGPWRYFICMSPCMPCFGFAQHFAQAEATGDNNVTSLPVTQFLKKTFNGEGGVTDSEKYVDGKVGTVVPATCCSPICLFH